MKRMKNNKPGNKLAVIVSTSLVCALLMLGQPTTLVSAEEDSVDAEVTVTVPPGESYGADVTRSYRLFLSQWSWGIPDNRGTWILYQGWTIIELESMVPDCEKISIWAANWGWWSSLFKVYASPDGISWQYIGDGKCTSSDYIRYDFSGSFQDVKYIMVTRTNSGGWAPMLLDAVYAKGGDA